jgi:hypothetical protein
LRQQRADAVRVDIPLIGQRVHLLADRIETT